MSSEKYPVGQALAWTRGDRTVRGEVIENFKLPGDICVRWENGMVASYDEWFLDENVERIP